MTFVFDPGFWTDEPAHRDPQPAAKYVAKSVDRDDGGLVKANCNLQVHQLKRWQVELTCR